MEKKRILPTNWKYSVWVILILLLLLSMGLMYRHYTKKECNNIFTKDFKNDISETFWHLNTDFSKEDFELVYKKLQGVSLTETKEVDQYDIPNPSFGILIKTKGDNYMVTIFDNYIQLESNYHYAASILGKQSQITYYKTNKNFFKDKEIIDIALKYHEISAKRMREDSKIK